MRFIKPICLILCLLLLVQPIFAQDSDLSVTSGCRSVDAAYPLGGGEKLVNTSKAVILYERSTGTLLYAYNADERIYPSSMVKLMTALVALEYGQLTDVVTVTQSMLNKVEIGSVSAGLKAGEQISLEDLLYCMMVASANDAAVIIADHIGGSQEAFIEKMNEMAAELGCSDTHFSNTTGLHDDETYTTTRDVLRILEAGLRNEIFKTMFETATYTVKATNKSDPRTITTTNDMMRSTKYRDTRVTGGKTGATSKAGRCLAVTATVGNMELSAVVMGAGAVYESGGLALKTNYSFLEMSEVLNYAQDNFTCSQLFYDGQVIDRYAVANGSSDAAVTPADEARCVLPKNVGISNLAWSYDDALSLTAPVAQGQSVTAMSVWYNGICLAQTDLVSMTAVDVYEPYQGPVQDPNEQQEERHGQILAVILGVIAGIAVLIFVAMLAIRAVNTAMIKARLRRRRRNRRRNRHARME